jgi:hypothetical protein
VEYGDLPVSEEFVSNAFRFAEFIKEQYKAAKIILLPNDDDSIELTKQQEEGGRYYPMILRMQEDKSTPSRIRLVIQIEEDTVTLLRRPEVMQWVEDCQTLLKKFHLKEFALVGEALFFDSLNALFSGNSTSGEVATFLNGWIVSLLSEQVQIERLLKVAPMPRDEAMQVLKAKGYNLMSKIHALQILLWMKIKPDDAWELIKYGMENIKNGQEIIFAPGQPIDRQRVLNCIKAWRKESE